MKLFKISQKTHKGWDTYSDAVVCAEDEFDAVNIHPDRQGISFEDSLADEDSFYSWGTEWTIPAHVKAEYLGEAKEGLAKGVICASYHAG